MTNRSYFLMDIINDVVDWDDTLYDAEFFEAMGNTKRTRELWAEYQRNNRSFSALWKRMTVNERLKLCDYFIVMKAVNL